MKFFALIAVFASLCNALHFYVDTDETKCFYEELPKDTIAVGKFETYELNLKNKEYEKVNNMKLEITVDVSSKSTAF